LDTPPASHSPDTAPVSWRIQGAVYGVGLFSNSSLHLYNVMVPIWAVMLTQDALLLGIIFGARHFLPMLLLIHGGALMDRFGARRVTVYFAVAAVLIPPLYPLLPFVSALIMLQMLGGLTVMTCWIGSQSLTGSVMRGKPVYTGRLTVATRIGAFVGPPLVGGIYDLAGVWAAFLFLSLWSALTLLSALALPKSADTQKQTTETPFYARARLHDALPRMSDYLDAFRLVAIPAIALVVAVTLLRHSGVAMQSNFYVVYLNDLGISGTFIGFLFSVLGVCGGLGALCVGYIAGRFSVRHILFFSLAVGVLMMTITPLIAGSGFTVGAEGIISMLDALGIDANVGPIAGVLGLYILFMLASGIRGLSSGISQAMEISLIAQSAGLAGQGKGAALRVTVGRVAAVILPVFMGAIAKFFGLDAAFYVVGGTILLLIALLAIKPDTDKP
jgi:MFS family permease